MKQALTLAIFDDPRREKDLMGRLNSYGSWAADTVRRCVEGAHGDIDSDDLSRLIADAEKLTARVLA